MDRVRETKIEERLLMGDAWSNFAKKNKKLFTNNGPTDTVPESCLHLKIYSLTESTKDQEAETIETKTE